MPNNTTAYCATNDATGYRPGSEYPSNITIQFDSFLGTPADGGSEEIPSRNSTETRAAYANGKLEPNSKLSTESSVRSHSIVLHLS
ncbi:hypothetical protein Leryth_021603 [Lithospermum erythrorhizon]|nr:hypothetical protein Leryth_021603 [Lithospermum erythrorhizon]